MKLRGDFVLRTIMDSSVAIPVGETALRINGMIHLNDVSMVIWELLLKGCSLEDIVLAIDEKFYVDKNVARADIIEFLEVLRKAQLLDE